MGRLSVHLSICMSHIFIFKIILICFSMVFKTPLLTPWPLGPLCRRSNFNSAICCCFCTCFWCMSWISTSAAYRGCMHWTGLLWICVVWKMQFCFTLVFFFFTPVGHHSQVPLLHDQDGANSGKLRSCSSWELKHSISAPETCNIALGKNSTQTPFNNVIICLHFIYFDQYKTLKRSK